MHIETLIGWRFLRARRRDRAISYITWISVVGVTLGVAALVVAISVINGFKTNMLRALTATEPHVRLLPRQGVMPAAQWQALLQKVRRMPEVSAAGPFVSRQAFLSAHGEYRAVILRGLEPDQISQVTGISDFQHNSVYDPRSLKPTPAARQAMLSALTFPAQPPAGAAVLLGSPLGEFLGVDQGETLLIISPVSQMNPFTPVPLTKRARVAGAFESGVSGLDEVMVFTSLRLTQVLFRLGEGADGLALRLHDPQSADLHTWQEAFPELEVQVWTQDNRNLFQVMRLEKMGLFLILSLIILVAFFNIIGSLVMLVLEKKRAIAILKALGASDGTIRRLFFLQGVWIGIGGTLAGVGLGLLLCWVLATFDVVPLPPNVYPGSSHLPVEVDWADLALIVLASLTICFGVTWFPANRAAKTQPIINLQQR